MKPTRSLHELEEERIVPWSAGGHFAWHRARYEFALPYAAGRRLLDVGTGEGYGASLLATAASEVVAVDYSPAAIDHARSAYRSSNLSFQVAEAASLPQELGSFDVVTAFELIEHLEDDAEFLAGVAALLRPHGVLLLSTPNARVERLVGSLGESGPYAYHVNSLVPRQLQSRLRRFFREVTLYGQSVRGSRLHALLKTVDVMNLRHYLVRSYSLQQKLATSVLSRGGAAQAPAFRFSRHLVRQSPHTIAVACRLTP